MIIPQEIIQNNIVKEWQEGVCSHMVALQRLRLSCNMAPKESIFITADKGWQGEVWEDPPKNMESIDNLNNKLHNKDAK